MGLFKDRMKKRKEKRVFKRHGSDNITMLDVIVDGFIIFGDIIISLILRLFRIVVNIYN